jgi:hypothetical protein
LFCENKSNPPLNQTLPFKKHLRKPVLNTPITKQKNLKLIFSHLICFHLCAWKCAQTFPSLNIVWFITRNQNLLILSLSHIHSCTQKQHYVCVTQIHQTSFL